MEITKTLNLSTAHISEETEELLDKLAKGEDERHLVVYPKKEYGWFVYIVCNNTNGLPDDLANCVELAKDMECTLICFDRDVESLPYLRTFDW